MAPPLRWGILGAGDIAATFADAVLARTRGEVAAVGSRSRSRGEAFADRPRRRHRARLLRGAVRRRRRRGGVRRHPALRAPRPRAAGHRGRQARAGGEGVHPQRDRGRGGLRGRPGARGLRDGGDVDPVPAAHRRAARGRRLRRDRRRRRAGGGPRAVLRARPVVAAVRPGTGRRRAARPRRLPDLVRARLPRRARGGHRGRVADRGRGRRAGVGDPHLRRRRAGDPAHDAAREDAHHRGHLGHRGVRRGGRRVLPADVVHGPPPAAPSRDTRRTSRTTGCTTRRPRWPGGSPPATPRARG